MPIKFLVLGGGGLLGGGGGGGSANFIFMGAAIFLNKIYVLSWETMTKRLLFL